MRNVQRHFCVRIKLLSTLLSIHPFFFSFTSPPSLFFFFESCLFIWEMNSGPSQVFLFLFFFPRTLISVNNWTQFFFVVPVSCGCLFLLCTYPNLDGSFACLHHLVFFYVHQYCPFFQTFFPLHGRRKRNGKRNQERTNQTDKEENDKPDVILITDLISCVRSFSSCCCYCCYSYSFIYSSATSTSMIYPHRETHVVSFVGGRGRRRRRCFVLFFFLCCHNAITARGVAQWITHSFVCVFLTELNSIVSCLFFSLSLYGRITSN